MPRKRRNRNRRRQYASVLAAHCPPTTYAEMRRARAPELDLEATWYVAYTAVRQERRAELGLLERGLSTFLPAVWVDRHDRKVCVQRPLFPRYLFVGMHYPAFGAIRDVVEIERLLTGSTGEPLSIHPEKLSRLVAAQNSVQAVSEPESIEPGQMVRIIEGPLAGLYAQVRKSTAYLAEVIAPLGKATVPVAQLERV